MSASTTPRQESAGRPGFFQRVAPAWTLFFMAPYVAEYLLGNMSLDALPGMVFVAPLYGGGALLIREWVRRAGGGWLSILSLALAYGLIEEGIAIQTLFNPSAFGLHLLAEANIPALGMGGWWTLFVLTLHTVWSITVPIAVTEALFPARRTQPWLQRKGIVITTLLYALGAIATYAIFRKQDPFRASPLQLSSTLAAVVLLGVIAFRIQTRSATAGGKILSPLLLGGICLALGAAFMGAHQFVNGWPVVGVYLALYALTGGLLLRLARSTAWTHLHELAAAGGAMLTYAIVAFPQDPIVGSKGTIDLVGNSLFAAVALLLLWVATRNVRRFEARTRSPQVNLETSVAG